MKTKPHIAAIALIGSTILISACSKALPVLTVDGVSYTNPMVLKIESNMVTISHADGPVDIPLDSLSRKDFAGVLLNGVAKNREYDDTTRNEPLKVFSTNGLGFYASPDILISNGVQLSCQLSFVMRPLYLNNLSIGINAEGSQWRYPLETDALFSSRGNYIMQLPISRYSADVRNEHIFEFVGICLSEDKFRNLLVYPEIDISIGKQKVTLQMNAISILRDSIEALPDAAEELEETRLQHENFFMMYHE